MLVAWGTMKLADRVQLMRKRRGWSQKELAARAGLSNAYVGMLERAGEMQGAVINNPTLAAVEALADALGVKPEWLAFGVGPKPALASPSVAHLHRLRRARRGAA